MDGLLGIGAHHEGDRREDRAGFQGRSSASSEHLKPRFFLRLVAVAAERFAALDRVGDVLGHVAQFSEFRPVASAGDMRLDQPGRHQAEEVEAPLFFVRRLMERPAPEQSPPRLIEGGVALGELGLKRCNLGLESRRVRLMALRIRFPFKRFAVKLLRLSQSCESESERNCLDQLMKLIEIRLIDLNGALAVEHRVDDLASLRARSSAADRPCAHSRAA